MATKAFKSEKIDAIKSKIEKAQSVIITEYQGLTVEEITKLRRETQKGGGDYMVTKNTLAKIAVKGTAYELLADKMTGPIALAFGFEDPVSPAKAVTKFIKEAKKGEILGAVLDGKLLSVEETKALAALPTKEELCQNAWFYQFAGIRYRKFYQCSYVSAYKSYGSCQRSKSCVMQLNFAILLRNNFYLRHCA